MRMRIPSIIIIIVRTFLLLTANHTVEEETVLATILTMC